MCFMALLAQFSASVGERQIHLAVDQMPCGATVVRVHPGALLYKVAYTMPISSCQSFTQGA